VLHSGKCDPVAHGAVLVEAAAGGVFLGATAVRPGRFNLWRTVFGATLVAISVSGLTLTGAADWMDPVFNGSALAVAVCLSSYLRRPALGGAG